MLSGKNCFIVRENLADDCQTLRAAIHQNCRLLDSITKHQKQKHAQNLTPH